MGRSRSRMWVWGVACLVVVGCAPGEDRGVTDGPEGEVGTVVVDYERYELPNGLEVIFHVDRSDPLAAVAMTFHVGSSHEVEGRTGFAHLFEHLFFLDSENLGPGGLDRLMTRVGSSTNGSTSRDRTNYFEVVPIDGLEKALWAEADKLGWFINTVTEDVVAKEKQVVKNEKRQGVDNNPYGHANFVIDRALYPEGHPYRWQVIGSLADLDAASLADVKAFHERWYGPNNATLVVAGDIDVEQTRAWIQRYFGEIPEREKPERPTPPEVTLPESRLLMHEDNFARLPQLQLAWPTVPVYHPDSYALDVLADLLTDGKTSPFYEVLVEEEGLAPGVSARHSGQELAGRFTLTVRAYADVDLDAVDEAIRAAFDRFETEGVPEEELRRVKAGTETAFYGGLSSAIGKAFSLAQYAIFANDPGFLQQDLERTLSVTADDVLRVYRTHLQGRPFVAASFVPLGRAELALEGSERAEVVEEPIVIGAEPDVVIDDREDIQRTPSAIDRSVEPAYGESPTLRAPPVWEDALANGVRVLGIRDLELPLVQFELRMRGGLLLEDPERVGVANLLAESMTEGTARRTPAELETAIDLLGGSISVSSGAESFTIRGSTLARNYAETMALVEEMLLEPRFDSAEFELARQRVQNTLRQRSASPGAIGSRVFGTLLYGDHVLARNALGTPATLESITLDDLRSFHARTLVPQLAAFHVVGAVDRDAVMTSLEGLGARWGGAAPEFPPPPSWDSERAGLYFVDVPNASQSVLNIGYLALAETDEAYYPAQVMNFRLGGGGFASDLTQELREGRGYTYGIGSSFQGSTLPGPFSIGSSVRSNVTFEALDLIKEILERFGPTFDEADLEATRSFLLRTNARSFETLNAKLGILRDMSSLGLEADYLLQREAVVRDFTIDEARRLADTYLDSEGMIWLVVGDAATQRARLDALGLGPGVLLDREGAVVDGG
ncbi:MAG: insulinase family protein [Gemmatimonadetes bacterium]|nr:insulinase family protein [Gemmatimonadota bacterium]MBT8403254.1 insulinase family protein [Gemmatimonadota bacterium]